MSILRKNIILLGLVQLSNYLFPLITFPYLSRILGPTGFGHIALAQSLILYLSLIIDFGFNLSATRKIGIAHGKNDQNEINSIFTSVMVAKTILLLMSCALAVIVTNVINQFVELRPLVFIGFISLLGSVCFPIWLFQGTQKMGGIVVSTTAAKFISLLVTFILVKKDTDLFEAMFASSLGMFISGMVAIYYVFKMKLAKFTKIKFSFIYAVIKESYPLFVSFIASSIYTTLNTIILSFFVPVREIGIYSAADKLKSVSQSVISPFQQAIFPNLSSHINEFDNYLKYLKKYGTILFGIGLCISIGLAVLSRPIIHLLLGSKFDESFNALLLMSPLPAIITLAVIFGQWGLVNIGESKKLSKIYVIGSFTHVLHVFFTIKYFGIYGAIFSSLFTETLLTTAMATTFLYEIKKRKLNV